MPDFDDAVPRIFTPSSDRRMIGLVANYLIQGGWLCQENFPVDAGGIEVVCHTALARWLRDRVGELRCLSLQMELELCESTGPTTDEQRDAMYDLVLDASAVRAIRLWWSATDVRQWVIGSALDELERHVPGLGRAVLSVIVQQSSRCYPLFTPAVALNMAPYLYWLGGEDESVLLEEFEAEDLAAGVADDIVTLQMFKEAFPDWALVTEPADGILDAPYPILLQAEEALADTRLREIVRLTASLSCLDISSGFPVTTAYDHIAFGAVLCWRDDDLSVRVSDDMAAEAYASGYCDVMGEVIFSLDRPDMLRDWLLRIAPHLDGIRLLDMLLWELAE